MSAIRLDRILATACLAIALLLPAACEREQRGLTDQPRQPMHLVTEGDLQPGPSVMRDTVQGPYDDNAYNTSEGQTLFESMNCSGCHSHGGGGMGPPLMDDIWIYGSRPDQIFTSIAEGRPDGMPAWKYRLNDKQIWQLVAYVRSLSGLTPKGARPTREDQMMVKTPNASTPNAIPKNVRLP